MVEHCERGWIWEDCTSCKMYILDWHKYWAGRSSGEKEPMTACSLKYKWLLLLWDLLNSKFIFAHKIILNCVYTEFNLAYFTAVTAPPTLASISSLAQMFIFFFQRRNNNKWWFDIWTNFINVTWRNYSCNILKTSMMKTSTDVSMLTASPGPSCLVTPILILAKPSCLHLQCFLTFGVIVLIRALVNHLCAEFPFFKLF